MAARLTGTPFERVMPRLVLDGDCLLWTGAVDKHGYGYVSGGRRGLMLTAYTVVYVETRGPVPDGLELDHTCERPSCCAPWHLEPVTHGENMARRYHRNGRCRRGHETTGRCMTCAMDRQRERRAAAREKVA